MSENPHTQIASHDEVLNQAFFKEITDNIWTKLIHFTRAKTGRLSQVPLHLGVQSNKG